MKKHTECITKLQTISQYLFTNMKNAASKIRYSIWKVILSHDM